MLGLFSAIGSMFGGGGLTKIATEFIETDLESAEAKALMIKTLDPNGNMRRQLSTFACVAYGFYLITTVVLIFMSVWSVGGDNCTTVNLIESCVAKADLAAGRMTELFLPITGSWAAIVSASFGVNGVNSYKGVK